MPLKTELGYLSHVRYADMENNETGIKNDGFFSVVIGNRFPESSADGIKNVVHLVSLEGLQDYIPDGTNNNAKTGFNKIRLVSLKNWSFISVKVKKN